MATKIVMPKLGLTMTEGTVEQWFVEEGDAVEQDQVVAEISSEKLTSDVMAPEAGTILKIVAHEGDVVPATDPIAHLGEEGETVEETSISEDAPAGETILGTEPVEEVSEEVEQSTPVTTRETSDDERIFITPVARRMAEEKGIDISDVNGTGGNGRITKLDIERYVPSEQAPAAAVTAHVEHGQGLEGMRKTIAQRMMNSVQTTAPVTHQSKADVTALMKFRKDIKANVNEPLTEGEISLNTLVTRAVIKALKEFPQVNSWYFDGEYIEVDEIHIGMATNVEDGLVVPVIIDADRMPLSELGPAIKEVTSQARAGTLDGSLYAGSTFSITNLGGFGVEYFTPIINTPEVAILGVGDLQKELALDEEGEVTERQKLPLSFTYDHQILDGAPAAEFIQKVTEYLEQPYSLFI